MILNLQLFLINRGAAYDTKGQYDRAIRDYDEAIELDRRQAVAFNNRGFANFNLGQHDRAIADYDEAIRLLPRLRLRNAQPRQHLARQRRYPLAPSWTLTRPSGSVGPRPLPLVTAASSRATAGQLVPALEDCNDFAAAQAGTTRSSLETRALIQLRRGRLDEAIGDYDAALKINPNLPGALHGRGLARQKKGDNAGADADMAAAKAIDGNVAAKFPKL